MDLRSCRDVRNGNAATVGRQRVTSEAGTMRRARRGLVLAPRRVEESDDNLRSIRGGSVGTGSKGQMPPRLGYFSTKRSNMPTQLMNLKVLLPYQVFADAAGVSRIVAETLDGSFGLVPQRLDCVAALTPGILIYETKADGEICIAVDEGVLIKTGLDVHVSARRALGGTDLDQLRTSVEREFLTLNGQELRRRSVLTKLESGFLREFGSLRNE